MSDVRDVRDDLQDVGDLRHVVDRFEIEALRGEFTDALMVHDYGSPVTWQPVPMAPGSPR